MYEYTDKPRTQTNRRRRFALNQFHRRHLGVRPHAPTSPLRQIFHPIYSTRCYNENEDIN